MTKHIASLSLPFGLWILFLAFMVCACAPGRFALPGHVPEYLFTLQGFCSVGFVCFTWALWRLATRTAKLVPVLCGMFGFGACLSLSFWFLSVMQLLFTHEYSCGEWLTLLGWIALWTLSVGFLCMVVSIPGRYVMRQFVGHTSEPARKVEGVGR